MAIMKQYLTVVLFLCKFCRILRVSRQPDCWSSPNSSQMWMC